MDIMDNYKFSDEYITLKEHWIILIRWCEYIVDLAYFNSEITHLFSYDKYTEFSWLYISISFWSLLISVVSSLILLLIEKKGKKSEILLT
jgi:uncharacterized membrane protein YkvI